MDDLKYGTRNKRGDWNPKEPIGLAPYLTWPRDPRKYVDWLIGYLFPWNLLFIVVALVQWFYLTPSIETMKTLQPGWIVYLFARNSALVLIVYGALELQLYVKREQVVAPPAVEYCFLLLFDEFSRQPNRFLLLQL